LGPKLYVHDQFRRARNRSYWTCNPEIAFYIHIHTNTQKSSSLLVIDFLIRWYVKLNTVF